MMVKWGMWRTLHDTYIAGPIPTRWTAPEAIVRPLCVAMLRFPASLVLVNGLV